MKSHKALIMIDIQEMWSESSSKRDVGLVGLELKLETRSNVNRKFVAMGASLTYYREVRQIKSNRSSGL